MIWNKERDLQMNDKEDMVEVETVAQEEIIELANKVLDIEREVRSDKSGNRSIVVGRIISLLNEVTENDNK